MECRTDDDPFDHVLVALAERLPDGSFRLGLTSHDDPRTRWSTLIGVELLNPTEGLSIGRDLVTSVRVVGQRPVRRVPTGLGDLEQRLILVIVRG